MSVAKRIEEWLGNLSCWVYENFIDPYYSETDETLLFKIRDYILLRPLDILATIYHRIFIRGYCALHGCELHYCNWNLPDDCHEWWCERCWAEGINHVVHTRNAFDNGEPLINFIEALKGN